MVGMPAARVTDMVTHPLPGMLSIGPGSSNVIIGYLPAWRGLPAMAAMALQAAKTVSDTAIKVAEAATVAAAGTPGAPVAKAAEETVKGLAAAAMSSMISSLTAASATASGGVPDIHTCATPLPIPPHGPGVVIDGSPTVLINGLPACVVGDKVLEALGPPDPIIKGMATVLIGDGSAGGGFLSMLGALAGMVGEAVVAALEAIGGAAAFIVDQVKAMIDLAKQTIVKIVDKVRGVVNAAIDAVIKGITQFAQGVARAAEDFGKRVAKAKHDLFPRVKGMDADAADAAIVQAQKDAVAALDKRIKDLDAWDEKTQKSFKKWFGSDDKAARDKMRERMVKAKQKLESFTLDNYESDDDEYAYVHPNDDKKMYLGKLFGKAPATGRNSKAGTLIHEASHYNSVGGTDDVEHDGETVYGERAAAKLAKDDPKQAQNNADNFEYFVEDGM